MNKVQLSIFQMHLHLVIMLQKHYYSFFSSQSQLTNTAQWQKSYIKPQSSKEKETPKKIIFLRQAFKKTIVDWKKVQKW